MFFSSRRIIPIDAEECLRKMRIHNHWKDEQIVAHFFNDVPYDSWQERFGHPSFALVHFFKRKDIIFPVNVFTSTIESDHFIRMLYTVLFCPLERCIHVNLYNFPQLYRLLRCPFKLMSEHPHLHACESIMNTLVACLSVLQMAIVIARYNNAANIENHAYAHLDAHMPLINGMASCRNHDIRKALVSYPVSLEWAITHESIPDISSLITMSVSASKMHGLTDNKKMISSKFRVLSANEVKIMYFLLRIIYKGMFDRCHNRDFWNFMRQAVGFDSHKRSRAKSDQSKTQGQRHKHVNEGVVANNVCMMLFFLMVTVASVLGLFPISKGKLSSIESRAKVYRVLIHLRNVQVKRADQLLPTLTSIFDAMFQDDNKLVLLSIFREYVTYLIEKTPGVVDAFKKAYNWSGNMKYVVTMSQIVRVDVDKYLASAAGPRFGNASFAWFGRIFSGTDHKLSHLYEESRRCQKETTMNYNITAIVKLCEDMNLKKYSSAAADKGAKLGREYMLENPHPQLDDHIEETMQELIATFSKNMWIPLDWLVCFGVPVKDIQFLRFAVFRKSTQLERYLNVMYRDRPHVYRVVYNFFKLSMRYKEYKEYPAPARMYLAHCEALNRYHNIYGHIPRVLGKMQICPKCGDMKKPSFFRALKKNKNGGGLSIVRVCLDGRMVCGRKPKSSSWLSVRNQSIKKNQAGKRQVRVKAHPDEFDSDEEEDANDDDDDEDDEDDDNDDDDDEDYDLNVHFHADEDDDDEDYQIGYNYDDDDDDDDEEEEDEDDDDNRTNASVPASTAELIFEKKKRVPASNHSSYTIRRKNAKHVATQHLLNSCRETETITIDTLGKIVVWRNDEWICCMQCIRSIPLTMAIDINGEKICTDCFLCNRSERPRFLSAALLQTNANPARPFEDNDLVRNHEDCFRCEAGVCTSRMKTTDECSFFLVFDDLAQKPAKKRFRNMILCSYHSHFPWLKEASTVLNLSTVIKAFQEKWGTRNGPKGAFISGPEFFEL